MRRALVLLLASFIALLTLTGCGDCLFLYPLASAENSVAGKALEGVWVPADAGDDFYVSIIPVADSGYLLETGHGGKAEGRYAAQLIELGGTRYLDLAPLAADGLDAGTLFGRGYVGFHRLYQVEQLEPALVARELDRDWLERALKFEPDAIRHEHVAPEGGSPYDLVLARQAVLEAFIARHSHSDRQYWASRKGEGDLVLVRQEPKL
jgi:hypothetical protein